MRFSFSRSGFDQFSGTPGKGIFFVVVVVVVVFVVVVVVVVVVVPAKRSKGEFAA
jgi:hypothetical protein